MSEVVSQGPYEDKPNFEPPLIEGWKWQDENRPLADSYRGWGQVNDGSWYAFYCNVGPGGFSKAHPTVAWNREHPDDSNWWYRDDWKSASGQLVCRHGAKPGECPDGSCGPQPGPGITDGDVIAAQVKALRLVQEMEEDFG